MAYLFGTTNANSLRKHSYEVACEVKQLFYDLVSYHCAYHLLQKVKGYHFHLRCAIEYDLFRVNQAEKENNELKVVS